MPKPVATRFTKFEFTHDELYAATRFSSLQIMLIQSLIADNAIEKNALKVDLSDGKSAEEAMMEFAQREAECTGAIGALEHLLMLVNETDPPTPETADSAADVSKPATPTSGNRR